jgi:hypothetical protein
MTDVFREVHLALIRALSVFQARQKSKSHLPMFHAFHYTLKSVQVRRARTLQALNWASKCHVSRAKVGLLRLKCSGVERQLANSGNKRPNEPPSSVQWFRELTRTGSAAHTKHETMHNQATLTDRAAMRRYYRPPPALSMPVLADSRVQKRGQRPGICALPLLAR